MANNLDKVVKLRAIMAANNIDAFIVPTADAHISEYVSDHDKRRAWISEFTGSAGTALITATEALLWTDGRYFLQANNQLQSHWTLMKQGVVDVPTMQDWCVANLKSGQSVGFDPFLVTASQFTTFSETFAEADLKFTPIAVANLVDQVWAAEQPPMSQGVIRVHPMEYAGESTASKVKSIVDKMTKAKSFAMVLCSLDEVAWVLNLRGSDIEFNPVFLSYLVITLEKCYFFVDKSKFSKDVTFDESLVEIQPYENITTFMATLKQQAVDNKAAKKAAYKVWVDSSRSNYAVFNSVGFTEEADIHAYINTTANPVTLMKAIKNKEEVEGMKNAHIRDGAAMCQFLSFFETQFESLPSIDDDEDKRKASPWNEFTVAEKLETYRAKQPLFVGLSFDTISSVGPNGAIIHYKPDETTSSPVTSGQIYLLDSGGQYVDGTTDITRTFYIPSKSRPEPTAFQKDAYTRVLQGHIDLASITFPPQTRGPSLDTLARMYLFKAGLDYAHGTGHGVGAALNVHEGPCSISRVSILSHPGLGTNLVEGMILSNEPGYYHDGEFGIRIENLVNIVPKDTKYGKNFLGFDNLTVVPIDRKLINKDDLSKEQIDYVNKYHEEVKAKVGPLVKDCAVTTEWLNRNTLPL